MAKAGRGSDQFALRLPEGLRERLKVSASKNNRSMNAEMIDRLENSEKMDDAPTFEYDIDSSGDYIRCVCTLPDGRRLGGVARLWDFLISSSFKLQGTFADKFADTLEKVAVFTRDRPNSSNNEHLK